MVPADIRTIGHPKACEVCTSAQPPQAINRVTVSLAISAAKERPEIVAQLMASHGHLLATEKPPSWARQAWSLATAIAGYVAGGFATVDAETYATRLAACHACPNRDNHRCRLCGCYVRPKAALPREHCPAVPSRWPAIPDHLPPIDILLPLGAGSRHANVEVRYALRSIARHATGYRRVVIVGAIPPWLRETDRLQLVRRDEVRGNKAFRIAAKIRWAFETLELTDTVAFWNDDYLLLRDTDVRGIKPHFHGDLARLDAAGWQAMLEATARALAAENVPTRHYDIHVPMLLEKAKYLELAEWWDKSSQPPGYTMKSVYGNHHCHAEAVPLADAKLGADWRSRNGAVCGNRWVVSYGPEALEAGFAEWMQDRWPTPAEHEIDPPATLHQPGTGQTLVCVLGPFRSGTSAVAGVLHRLGVPMGSGWPTPSWNTGGTYEDRELARLCRKWFQEPEMIERRGPKRRIRALRRWLAGRTGRAAGVSPPLLGAKHPTLCLCIPQLLAACPAVRFVAVDRPRAEIVASLQGRGRPVGTAEATTAKLIATRDHDLAAAGQPVHRLAYHELLADPAAAVAGLIEALDLQPSKEQRGEAIAWIDPQKRTVRAA